MSHIYLSIYIYIYIYPSINLSIYGCLFVWPSVFISLFLWSIPFHLHICTVQFHSFLPSFNSLDISKSLYFLALALLCFTLLNFVLCYFYFFSASIFIFIFILVSVLKIVIPFLSTCFSLFLESHPNFLAGLLLTYFILLNVFAMNCFPFRFFLNSLCFVMCRHLSIIALQNILLSIELFLCIVVCTVFFF